MTSDGLQGDTVRNFGGEFDERDINLAVAQEVDIRT
jgi:hypothetical protein